MDLSDRYYEYFSAGSRVWLNYNGGLDECVIVRAEAGPTLRVEVGASVVDLAPDGQQDSSPTWALWAPHDELEHTADGLMRTYYVIDSQGIGGFTRLPSGRGQYRPNLG